MSVNTNTQPTSRSRIGCDVTQQGDKEVGPAGCRRLIALRLGHLNVAVSPGAGIPITHHLRAPSCNARCDRQRVRLHFNAPTSTLGDSVKLALVRIVFLLLPAACLLLAACATRPAPGISGRWKAVNYYAATPQEIPLYQAYLFRPSPLDGTLKAMLARWARDSNMTLSYQHTSDFTLSAPVAQIRTSHLAEAAATLSSIYTPQHLVIGVDGDNIVVRRADPPIAAAGVATSTAAPR